jgi:hypothetical protein
VLDISNYASIIYIWYEDGLLRLFLVNRARSHRVACQAAATDDDARETQMKGGIKDNGEESQGREEEGRQETVS